MMSLTFGLFTQVSGSGPLGPLVMELFPFENFSLEIVSAQKLRNPLTHFHEIWYKYKAP